MILQAGSLLIAHPVHATREHKQHVVYVTESTSASTMGITLNNPSSFDLATLMKQQGIEWTYNVDVYYGGEYNPHALVMLHTDEWYSSNTMQVDGRYSISSDNLMIEKLDQGNSPDWYQLFLGCKGWTPQELSQELAEPKPKWLVLRKPSTSLMECPTKYMWDMAVTECSQQVIETYF